jgi:Tol biopolymer transport system component
MALAPGLKLGPYEIVAPLGAGGMGEVYRARDSKLKRDVAIKVLPDDVAGDSERLARFQREAEVLASMNHPHIAQVFGIEGNALVMELVEGEDLAQRIARGAIPVDEALPIARQIAEALEAAHEAGVIHRDLKPANIKLRSDGTVKVLDFGLAKQGSGIGDRGSGNLANSPTITTPAMTMHGMILGTAAYMAPEQAKGKAVDRRADIWAFGCVLYEMLTGQRTFAGDDVSDTLVSILRDDPRWAALPANTPPHVRLLLRRCLQRDPQKRLPHIGAARLDLSDADTSELTKTVAPSSSRWRFAALGGAIAGALIAGVAVLTIMRGAPLERDAVVSFALDPPAGGRFAGGNMVPRFAVSPDGQEILYQIDNGSDAQLLIRKLGSVDPIALPAGRAERSGNSMQQAFWSPDGRAIAFFDEGTHQLKKLDRQFGTTQVLASVPGNQYGGTWNHDDVILMGGVATGGIQRVPAAGGTVAQVTTVDPSRFEASHLWPKFFADGRHFVYLTLYTNGTPPAVFLGSLDGSPARRLAASPAAAHPAPPDYLVLVLEGATVAQRVDLAAGTLIGDPVPVSASIGRTPTGRAALSVSNSGVMIYSTAGESGDRFDTRWVNRSGAGLASVPKSVSTRVRGLRLSPDGSLLAYVRGSAQDPGSPVEVWVQDVARGIDSKVTNLVGGLVGHSLVFSPDQKEFLTRSISNSVSTLARQPLFGAEPPRPLLSGGSSEMLIPYDWTPDGKLVVNRAPASGGGGFWIVPVTAGEKPVLYMASPVRFGADLSPDGRWLAYTAGANAGEGQIFLQAFPDARGGKWPVSAVGASHPRWSHDGQELYFMAGGQLNAVTVSTSPGVAIGQPKGLFAIEGRGMGDPGGSLYPYDVLPKDQGFVYLAVRGALPDAKVVVVTDWMRAAGIKQ